MGSPAVFSQTRAGFRGQEFLILKFRTMTSERSAAGELLKDSDRLTPFGIWLRSTSLDELPELFNILKGDMSLVGPRPLLLEYTSRYSTRQLRRLEVLPGLSGWAQINGRNALSWEKRLEMDVWYVENRSIFLDVKILFLTLFRVFGRVGINCADSATMEEFRGND